MQESPAIAQGAIPTSPLFSAGGNDVKPAASLRPSGAGVPDYLSRHYWWAYVHPNAVRVFERDWLVNLILWGNYPRLRDAALAELGDELPGRTLQVACVYGDLTPRLSERAAAGGGTVDVVDVLLVQLNNLRRKLSPGSPARLLQMDSTHLDIADATYDRALVFFLLHEQPAAVRERTLSEVIRVVRPGGKILIVDYANPRWWHPLRYLWLPVLEKVEPFAPGLWQEDIADWLPVLPTIPRLEREALFGGLYQKVVVTR
jgi:ubiquinone/menaquinone biosynthesis C-methylase UbiE